VDGSDVIRPGVAKYVTQLEYGYALHELTFAVLFLPIVAIPFAAASPGPVGLLGRDDREHRLRGHHRPLRLRLLRQSLIGVIVLPVALLISTPACFASPISRKRHRSSGPLAV
jgi:hypothetical protein